MRILSTIVFAVAFLGPLASMADVKSGDRIIECYCTDKNGERVELGELICMQVDGRMFMARCEMSLNNPMWREVSTGCLSSSNQMTPLPDGFFADLDRS